MPAPAEPAAEPAEPVGVLIGGDSGEVLALAGYLTDALLDDAHGKVGGGARGEEQR